MICQEQEEDLVGLVQIKQNRTGSLEKLFRIRMSFVVDRMAIVKTV